MVGKKPVVKVWCLPAMRGEELEQLHKDIVDAAVSVGGLHLTNEKDLIVLFPTGQMHYGLGSEILIEYTDVVDKWRRSNGELDELSSRLGNALKQYFPAAFVQSEARNGNEDQSFWTSEKSTSREEVARIYAAAQKLLPKLNRKAQKECYCEDNALDHKGPCGHHNAVGAYRYAIKQGAFILATTNPAEFQALADVYASDCRNSMYLELHYKLGWEKRPENK